MNDTFVGLSALAALRRARVVRMLVNSDAYAASAKLRRRHFARKKYEEEHEQRLAFAIKVAQGKHLEVDDD